MRLFSNLREMINSQSKDGSKPDNAASQEGGGISFDMMPPEDSIDVDHLQGVITEFYDVSQSNSKVIAECIENGYFEGYGYDKITRKVKEEGVALDRDQIYTIVWTELVLCQSSIEGYSRFSLIRASSVVNRQSMSLSSLFRSFFHAATS